MLEMNDDGLERIKEKEELERNQKKEKEYQDYLRLRKQFEGDE